MATPLSSTRFLCALFLPVVGLPKTVRADSDVSRIVIDKAHEFHQSATGTTVESSTPYIFDIEIDGSASGRITSASFTPPAGSAKGLTTQDGVSFGNEYDFTDKAAFDSAFPSGSYVFNLQTVTVPLSYSPNLTLTSDAYPNAPVIQNTGWAGGFLQIDPTKSYLFTWTSPGSSSADNVWFGIDGVVPFQSAGSGSGATSFLLPAGSLVAGNSYDASLSFFDNNTFASDNGTLLSSAYRQDLGFGIVATPEPTSAILLAFGVGALVNGSRRRWGEQ